MIYTVGQAASELDLLSGKLKAGDEIRFARGGSSEVVKGLDVTAGLMMLPSGEGDLYRIIVGKSASKQLAVIRVRAGDHVAQVGGVCVWGGYQALLIGGGVKNVTVKDFQAVNPSGYGIYVDRGGAVTTNDNLKLVNVVIHLLAETSPDQQNGDHCIRIYNARNMSMSNVELIHNARYGGVTIAAKQVEGFHFRGIKTQGHAAAFGPNPNDPVGYFCKDGLVEDFVFDNDRFMSIAKGCENIRFRNGTISTTGGGGGAVLSLSNDAKNITFENVKLRGGTKPYSGGGSGYKFPGTNWSARLDGVGAKAVA